LAVQIVLMVEWDVVPFLIFWHLGKLFGFMSTLASGFIIQEIAPSATLGMWNARNDALTNIGMGVAPLIFAPVYDGFGNKRGQEMLAITAGISLLAVLAYTPLMGMLPKPKKEEKDTDLQEQSVYDAMPDVEYQQLPMEIIERVDMRSMEQKRPPRVIGWGKYEAEYKTLPILQKKAGEDLKYYKDQCTMLLTNAEMMTKEKATFKELMEALPKVDRDTASAEMGAWLADYLDDAGYANWETQCVMFKVMMMNAFPPIDDLDMSKCDYGSMPIECYERMLTKLLNVMDSHLATHHRQQGTGVGAGSAMGLFRRR